MKVFYSVLISNLRTDEVEQYLKGIEEINTQSQTHKIAYKKIKTLK